MTDPGSAARFAFQLMQQDESLHQPQYKEYRMELEKSLERAVAREKLASRVAVVAFLVGLSLMFVGGSRVCGSFDPWSADATALSVAMGVIYVLASVVWVVALASYLSRFRPGVRRARERLLEQSISELRQEVQELRRQVGGH